MKEYTILVTSQVSASATAKVMAESAEEALQKEIDLDSLDWEFSCDSYGHDCVDYEVMEDED